VVVLVPAVATGSVVIIVVLLLFFYYNGLSNNTKKYGGLQKYWKLKLFGVYIVHSPTNALFIKLGKV
jgi:hypothetical protein